MKVFLAVAVTAFGLWGAFFQTLSIQSSSITPAFNDHDGDGGFYLWSANT